MSTTASSPQAPAPGNWSCPHFGQANVTVTAAGIAAGSSAPVSQFKPLGQSTARTGSSGHGNSALLFLPVVVPRFLILILVKHTAGHAFSVEEVRPFFGVKVGVEQIIIVRFTTRGPGRCRCAQTECFHEGKAGHAEIHQNRCSVSMVRRAIISSLTTVRISASWPSIGRAAPVPSRASIIRSERLISSRSLAQPGSLSAHRIAVPRRRCLELAEVAVPLDVALPDVKRDFDVHFAQITSGHQPITTVVARADQHEDTLPQPR